jgi:hypothetical protein
MAAKADVARKLWRAQRLLSEVWEDGRHNSRHDGNWLFEVASSLRKMAVRVRAEYPSSDYHNHGERR